MNDPSANMNDKDLDNLFRKAAEDSAAANSQKISSSLKEETWEKLQKKLDEPLPEIIEDKNLKGKKKWGWLMLILLAISGIIIWKEEQNGAGKLFPSVASNQTSSKVKPKDQNIRSHSTKEINKITTLNVKPQATHPKNTLSFASSNKKDLSGKERHVRLLSKLTASVISEVPMHLNQIPNKGIILAHPSLPDLMPLSDPSVPIVNYLKPWFKEYGDSQKLSITKQRNRNKLNGYHWYLGISAGPDWSSASGEGWGTGACGGLILDYKVGRKWWVETGIFTEKALYTASPYNYNPPGNVIYSGLQSIQANCMIFDVPLNVNYVLWNNSTTSVLIGTGISSVIMHHEAYTYNIKTNSGEWEQYRAEMYNKEHHLFSILNFSAGYEKSWNHFSFEAAPYVKIPLTGIGYGRVKLLSTGIQFTLKYGIK